MKQSIYDYVSAASDWIVAEIGEDRAKLERIAADGLDDADRATLPLYLDTGDSALLLEHAIVRYCITIKRHL